MNVLLVLIVHFFLDQGCLWLVLKLVIAFKLYLEHFLFGNVPTLCLIKLLPAFAFALFVCEKRLLNLDDASQSLETATKVLPPIFCD